MAALSSSARASEKNFNNAIREGRKLTQYLFYDISQLDQAERMKKFSCQLPNQYPLGWIETIETGRSPVTFGSISRALQSLIVGDDDENNEKHLRRRSVSAEVYPKGPNIPIRVIEHVRCAPPKLRSVNADFVTQTGGHHRGFEGIFNVCEGVITITDITFRPARPNEEMTQGCHGP